MKEKISLLIMFTLLIFFLSGCEDMELKDWIEKVVLGEPEITVKQGDSVIVSGGSYTFAETRVFTQTGVIFTIENEGDSELTLTGSEKVSITGTDDDYFTVSLEPDEIIPAGESTEFQIDFVPTQETSYEAIATIRNDDPSESNFTFTLMGNGNIPFNYEVEKLMASDAQDGDSYGMRVGISDNYVIIGVPWAEVGGESIAGAAYIYYRTGPSTWGLEAKITAPDFDANDYFGWSVAIDGDYAIVGAPGEDTGAPSRGSAYIFRRTGTNTWDSGTKIEPTVSVDYAYFGKSVAISGEYAIVGADTEYDYGSVYFYHRTSPITWSTGERKREPDFEADAYFGCSVAIDGEYAIVGSNGKDGNTGAAYIFRRSGENWTSQVPIAPSDLQSEDWFGYSVSIHGEYAIVGAPYEDGGVSGPTNSGCVYFFHCTGLDSWDTGTKVIAYDGAANDYFGHSVSIWGDYALVGAYGFGSDFGAAYILYRSDTTAWDILDKIEGSDTQVGDEFGISVSIGDEYSIIGAYNEDGGTGDPKPNAGAVYIFR